MSEQPRTASDQADRPSPEAARAVRVVLLGEPGLDASVRGDATIETVRPRTPLEAVGEVAAPPASARGARTIVVVGQGGEPEGEQGELLRALRRADPGVKLVRVGANGTADPGRLYDEVLRGPATSEALHRVADSGMPVAHAEPKPAPSPETRASPVELPTDPDRAPRAETPVEHDGPDDPPIVETRPAALASEPGGAARPGDLELLMVLPEPRHAFERVALRLIHDRTGHRDVRFVSEEKVTGGAAVAHGSRRFGALVSDSLGSAKLAPHAAWLGAWLDHHDRQRSLRRAAFTDPLTGAWNRRYFDGFLHAALDRARDARRTVTVLVFDIDEFKMYNDQYGHPAGDEILIETVRALKSSVRPSDRVCRIGGDEFAVVFDEPEGPRQSGSRPPESVYVLAKRVQQKIGEKEFPKLGADAKGTLTISGGLAAFPWDGHDAETLLARADELACQSKRAGKNAITVGPGAERVCKHPGDDDAC